MLTSLHSQFIPIDKINVPYDKRDAWRSWQILKQY